VENFTRIWSLIDDLLTFAKGLRSFAQREFSNLHMQLAASETLILCSCWLLIEVMSMNESREANCYLMFLPLASSVDYHTLYETKSTEKVIEVVGHDFSPTLPWSLNLLFCRKRFGLVVSIVVPLMLAVLPYARGRGFESRSRLLELVMLKALKSWTVT
jgi:hypothetical protein